MKTAAKKRAPGRNIAEAERNTEAIKLRLTPDVAKALRVLARGWKCTLSDAVTTLVEGASDDYEGDEGS